LELEAQAKVSNNVKVLTILIIVIEILIPEKRMTTIVLATALAIIEAIITIQITITMIGNVM
jgi:hypothetical protein